MPNHTSFLLEACEGLAILISAVVFLVLFNDLQAFNANGESPKTKFGKNAKNEFPKSLFEGDIITNSPISKTTSG